MQIVSPALKILAFGIHRRGVGMTPEEFGSAALYFPAILHPSHGDITYDNFGAPIEISES